MSKSFYWWSGGATSLTWSEEDDGHGDEGADNHDDQQSDGDALPVPLRRTDPAQVLRKDKEKKRTQGRSRDVRFGCSTLHSTRLPDQQAQRHFDTQRNNGEVRNSRGGRINKEKEKRLNLGSWVIIVKNLSAHCICLFVCLLWQPACIFCLFN